MYDVHPLRSLQTGRGYLGWTTDLRRRLCQHNEGISRATRNRGPDEPVYFEAYRHSASRQQRDARFQEVGG